jgi:hypothetical protein
MSSVASNDATDTTTSQLESTPFGESAATLQHGRPSIDYTDPFDVNRKLYYGTLFDF